MAREGEQGSEGIGRPISRERGWMTFKGRIVRGLKVLFLIAFTAVPDWAQAVPARTKGQTATKAISVVPFSLDRVSNGLKNVKNHDFTEAALIKRLLKDGISFTATQENVQKLKDAGASAALIDTVTRLAPPPTPPPTIITPVPKGSLVVNCSPAECEVVVGARSPMRSVSGTLKASALPEGIISVNVLKDGFMSSKSAANIVPDKTVSVSVDLTPTVGTLQLWGEQMLEKALAAMGGEPGLRQAKSVYALGDCTIWGRNGNPYQSSIQTLMRLPGKAFFRIRAGKAGSFESDYLPDFQVKTNFPEQEARDLDAGLRLLKDYQSGVILDSISSGRMSVTADKPVPIALDGAAFHAVSSTESYTVVLDADGRPREIRAESPAGKGIRAEYSQYQAQEGIYFPATVLIVWPGTPQQGIQVHFSTFQINPGDGLDAKNRLKKNRRFW